MSGNVVIDSVAKVEGEAALIRVRRELRVSVAGVEGRVRAAVSVPVRGRSGSVGPRALRGSARPRGDSLAATLAGDRASLLVAARPHLHYSVLQTFVGMV